MQVSLLDAMPGMTMRNLWTVLCGIAALSCLPCRTAAAADWYTGAPAPTAADWIVAVDSAATISSQGSRFADLSVTGAADGTLRESGVRVRVEGLVGRYNYKSGDVALQGDQVEGAALTGYEWIGRNAAIAGFVGLDVRSDRTPTASSVNTDFATSAGLKTAFQAYVQPSDRTVIQAYGSFSTDRSAYYARLRGGLLTLGSVYVGPEVVVLGDNTFSQWRVGAHLIGMQIGPVQFGVSAGYLRDSALKNGVYTSLDVRTVF